MSGAKLQGANLQDANLEQAILQGAKLQGANLRGANLQMAYLKNVNLQGAGGYSVGRFEPLPPASYNGLTIWPSGFDPQAAGAILVDD